MKLVEVRINWRGIWHHLFGHTRIGYAGERWNYSTREPDANAFYCYGCGQTFLRQIVK